MVKKNGDLKMKCLGISEILGKFLGQKVREDKKRKVRELVMMSGRAKAENSVVFMQFHSVKYSYDATYPNFGSSFLFL